MDATSASDKFSTREERAVHAYLGELARRIAQVDSEIEPLRYLRSSLGTRLRPRSARLRDRLRFSLAEALLPPGLKVGKVVDSAAREAGEDYPQSAATMVGLNRLLNLRDAIMTVDREEIPGDFIETGVWRGGASLFMRCALEVLEDRVRTVILADSFAGLPPPGLAGHSEDELDLSGLDYLAVSRTEVEALFESHGMLDSRVEFVEGWFHETLPTVRDRRFAVIRLDGDLYSSTMIALENLYPGLSKGGFCIIDDYQINECRRAVEDFRAAVGSSEEMFPVDASSIYWRKA